MNNIVFKTITNLEDAKKAWEQLSPNYYLHDDWNFRYLYYKYFNYPLYFYSAYDQNQLIALLPLMFNKQLNALEFFAGFEYMENNRIFIRPGYEYVKQQLINQVVLPFKLDYMDDSMKDLKGAEIHDYNYFINLSEMSTYADFIDSNLSSKSRRNLKSQINKIIEQFHPKIYLSNNIKEDLGILRKFNLERFGEKSSYSDRPYWKEYIEDVSTHFNSRLVVLESNGEKMGIGLSINYNQITYGINIGYNDSINNIGKFMTLLKIDQSIKDSMKTYDALGGGTYGWKKDFHLLTRPFYIIKSNE